MRAYVADVAETLCALLCVLVGHAHGCWLLNSKWSPIARLQWWAVNARWDDPGPQHSACPTCHFDRGEYVPRQQYHDDLAKWEALYEEVEHLRWTSAEPQNVTTAAGGSTTVTSWKVSRG